METLIEKVLQDICLDSRISDGIFQLDNNSHLDILREYFLNKRMPAEDVIYVCNRLVEGKYPERQAYNKNGILVTFPTPEYKQRALKRGTHFEKDPTKKDPNIFSGEKAPASQAPAEPQSSTEPAGEKGGEASDLPISDVEGKSKEQVPQTGQSPNEPTTDEPDGDQPPDEPEKPSTNIDFPQDTIQKAPEPNIDVEKPPVEVPKSPEEKEAEKNAIINMLRGSEDLMQQVSEWISNNGPEYLLKEINKRKSS
jgi:hypothetical protein